MKQATARIYNCERCHRQVKICNHCDRGNIYCKDCSLPVRRNKQREAGKRYQQTFQGKQNNAARQNRFREAQHKKNIENVAQDKKVTHQGSSSAPSPSSCHQASEPGAGGSQDQQSTGKYFCHFCSCDVSDYLRQDFIRYSAAKIRKGSLSPAGP